MTLPDVVTNRHTPWLPWTVGFVLVLAGWPTTRPDVVAAGVMTMLVSSAWYLWHRRRVGYVQLAFLAAFGLFLTARIVAHVVLRYPPGDPNRFGMPFNRPDVETHVFAVLGLALAGLQASFVLLDHPMRRRRSCPPPRCDAGAEPVADDDPIPPSTGRFTRRIGAPALVDAVRTGSLTVFLVTLPLQVVADAAVAAYIAGNGYLAYYTSYSSPLPGPARVVAGAFQVAFVSYLATRPTRRQVLVPTILYLGQGLATLASGQRSGFLLNVVVVAVYVAYRQATDGGWITRRIRRAVLVAVPLVAVTMTFIGAARTTATRQLSGVLAPFADLLYAQGTSIEVIGYGFVYRAQLPGDHLYSLAPVTDLVTRRIPGAVGLGPGVLTGQTPQRALESGWFSHLLSYLVMPRDYLRGRGLGSAYPAELWADFSYPGVFVGSFLLGAACWLVTLGMGGSWLTRAAALLVARDLVLAPRASVSQFVVEALTASTVTGVVLVAAVAWVRFRGRRGRSASGVASGDPPVGSDGAAPGDLRGGPGDRSAGGSRLASLRGPVGWSLAGSAGYLVSQWLVLAIIARSLGTSAVGTFSLASALVGPLLVLTQLQLRIVLATDVAHRHRWGDFLWIRAVSSVVLLVGVGLLAVIGGYPDPVPAVLVAFAVAKAFDAIADILYGQHQRDEDMRTVAVGMLLNGVLSATFLAAALATGGDLVAGVVGYAAGSAVTLVGWVVPVTVRARRRDRADPRDQPSARWALARRAGPLTGVLALGALAASIPRLVVDRELGADDLGIFAGVSYLVLAVGNLVNATGHGLSARLARHHSDGDVAVFGQVTALSVTAGAAVALAGAAVALVVGGPLLTTLYSPDYAGYGPLLAALFAAAAFGFAASFAAGAATAAQRFRQQLPVAAIACLVAAVASGVLVPAYGLTGAAVATGLTGVAQLAGGVLVLRSAKGGTGHARTVARL